MKLLEFPCGWWTGRPEDSSPPASAAAAAAAAAATLTAETAASTTRSELPEKRRRHGSSSASAWRPSLVAIDEDGAPAVVASTAAKAGAKKVGAGYRRPGQVNPGGRVAPRGGHGNHRHYGVPIVVTAFAPTPFLF